MANAKHTPGPWNLVWWGNETYPYPLSILANNDGAWVTRGGTVSSEANARLIAAAPAMLEALKAWVEELDGTFPFDTLEPTKALIALIEADE